MTNSTSKNLVLNLIYSKDSYYSFSSINQELKKENKIIFNQKKWSKINVIDTNNEFIILPSKIPEFLKNINIDKTIGNSPSTEKKTKRFKKLNFTFYIKKNKENKIANNINHIGNILLDEFLANTSISKKMYLSIIHNKLYVCVVDKKNLLFYNQFEFSNSDYLKYILLVFDEYELDRKKIEINLLDDTIKLNELKKFFNKINLYKKSIFEIIDKYNG
ncbi:MAG: DUF3822 family protein [Bacteroidota bacterium]|nr:DUF3822 family protein [Bacteroidota bacterium]